ncbi:MAG: MSCRAMM family adhesin SdrC [Caldilineaceae bacterium]|nr:MSCRAMM family adhesin SdrC [Caldilineaceae bacterium]
MKNHKKTSHLVAALLIAFVFALIVSFAPNAASANADLANGFVTGTVWNDTNRNGVMEPNELPLANHEVYLQRTDGEVNGAMVAVVVTDRDGTFKFENLEFGAYQVFPDGGDYVLVEVHGISATATVDLPVIIKTHHFVFIPTIVR